MGIDQIATVIKQCRKRGQLTQQGLAQLAGVGKTVVFDIEKGKETVRLNSLLKVLDALNIKLELRSPITIEESRDEKSAHTGS